MLTQLDMLTKDPKIVQSSHQKGAADNLLANNRKATATVAATTLTMLPSHTFHARLTSGGRDMAVIVSSKNKERENDQVIALGIPHTEIRQVTLLTVRVLAMPPVGTFPLVLDCKS